LPRNGHDHLASVVEPGLRVGARFRHGPVAAPVWLCPARRLGLGQSERPHQGLRNERLAPTTALNGTGPVRCRQRLGGLLKFYYYYREAA
jgi:hypothetical protein